MNKIVILGKNGNLGGYFMDLYADQNPIGLSSEDLNITDKEAVKEKIRELNPAIVINCTAYNAVDKAEEDYKTAEAINGSGPGVLASVCKEMGATLVHFSSGMVFDGSNQEGYKEDDATDPVNAYGRSKLVGEMEVQKNTDKFYIIRTSWLFGRIGSGKSNKRGFPDIMLDVAAKNSVVEAVNDEFGKPTYLKDLAQATRALVEQANPYGIYHITNEEVCSRFDWTKVIYKIKNINVELKSVSGSKFDRLAKRPKYEVLNNMKFIKLRPWTEALEEYLV